MPLDLESLSDAKRTAEVGTENVLEPQILRAYNELLHRVTGSVKFSPV